MKNLNLILIALLVSGCGKATVKFPGGTTLTVDTSGANPIQTALADITACPAGMTLFPTTTGVGAFCMDTANNGSNVSNVTAVNNCVSQGKSVCSTVELARACRASAVTLGNYYWTSDMSGANNYPIAEGFDPSICAGGDYTVDLSSSVTAHYYCCSR